MAQRIVRVALNVPLSRMFDYRLPDTLPVPGVGERVRVPFGRQKLVGLVMELADTSDIAPEKLKVVLERIDASPVVDEHGLWLIRFASAYYHHPIGEVVAAALPTLLRQGKPAHRRVERVRPTDETPAETDLRRAPKQRELYEYVAAAGRDGVSADALNEALPGWRPAFRQLDQKGLLQRTDDIEPPAPDADFAPGDGPTLNAEQETALAAVRDADGFKAFLLDGVTGSGKTEVYLQLIIDVIQSGRQVLVLVPEIGLTPQLVDRFRARLGIEPVVMHSALTDSERLDGWQRARSGEAKLIVGTRSSVFVPLPAAGLIVVDEEHDASLKQQEGFRYSARDLAIARAKEADIPVVLGSATPTLESLSRAESGDYQRLPLTERAGGARPPRVRLVDLARSPAVDGLSVSLIDAMQSHLESGGQVLLFLNRRGFAPTLICTNCAHVAECARCDARMTVHAASGRLKCHHCGSARAIDASCESCGADMRPLGEGTERLETALNAHFPDRTVKRIDSDTIQHKGAIGEALALATQGHADILIGTQMLSKGHHFPSLTLVGIVNADQGLFSTDFRGSERLAQSIVQVAGRAGREQRVGEVLIQTAFASHVFWSTLLDGGYPAVAKEALAERESMGWPPYSRLALLRASAHDASGAMNFLMRAKRLLPSEAGVRLLGPVNAPMAKRAGRYRAQLLLQSTERRALHAFLSALRTALEADPAARKVRWSIDVDPIELL